MSEKKSPVNSVIGTKLIIIDGEEIECKIIRPHKVAGANTFSHKSRCRYKNTRTGRLKKSTNIKTRKIQEEGESIKSEWGDMLSTWEN